MVCAAAVVTAMIVYPGLWPFVSAVGALMGGVAGLVTLLRRPPACQGHAHRPAPDPLAGERPRAVPEADGRPSPDRAEPPREGRAGIDGALPGARADRAAGREGRHEGADPARRPPPGPPLGRGRYGA
ncbi:hypothetical protein [Spirillospora sp. NPDC029432]|uniref:hypothetical protein n=1 Tax=Spirillospora sp. NPDC029432 TaxID=3154599 RepID=UPI00345303BB